jgi:hypothetical protein
MLLIPQSSTGPAYVSLPVWQHGAHGHVGGGQPADVVEVAGDAEVGQQDSTRTRVRGGEQDVGRFDVAVQQAALVGVVEGLGDRRAEDEPAGALGQGPRRLLDPAGRRA